MCALASGYCGLAPAAALEWSTALNSAGKTPAGLLVAASDTSDKRASRETASSAEPPLSAGDSVSVQVYGKPEFSTKVYVSDDGTIQVPLAGSVKVAGLSSAKAAERIAAAFRQGNFLVNPQVTVSRSQQVSVLGAVRTPGRFTVESKTTVLDVLAQAGGTAENGGDIVVLLRTGADGQITRHPINLKGLTQENTPVPTLVLRGGDSLFVPPAEQFYINGEVRLPNTYRLEPGMTVIQALARGGGVTPRGSRNRIEISRRKADGSYITIDGKLNDTVQVNDVIRVKERIF